MTPTQRKAMQDALEALTKSGQFCNHMGTGDWQPTAMACHGAIAALRNTLAEPAPVPLLTDEEILKADCVDIDRLDYEVFEINQASLIDFARAIEALVRKKAVIK